MCVCVLVCWYSAGSLILMIHLRYELIIFTKKKNHLQRASVDVCFIKSSVTAKNFLPLEKCRCFLFAKKYGDN